MFLRYEECPRCARQGRDRAGDNLGVYVDGSTHCFSCGYHRHPKTYVRKVVNVDENKAVLPSDFTREVPAAGWKWLLQWGLPYTYWKRYAGYSEAQSRLVLTIGEPTKFSIGRYLGTDKDTRKWKLYGNGHGFVEILGKEKPGPIVLVEDIVSWHKVGQVAPCLCLFGTNVHSLAIKELKAFKRPVMLWLDDDQYTLYPPKVNRLQTFLDVPVGYIHTKKDPKGFSLQEIERILS